VDLSLKHDCGTGPEGSEVAPPADVAVAGAGSRGRLLARLLDGSLQAFVGSDFEGRVTCLNRAFAALAGLEPAALLGRRLAEVTPPALHGRQAWMFARVRSTGMPMRFEAEVLHADGRAVPIGVAAEPDLDASGAPVGVVGFVTDLSERNRSADALHASERRARALFDGVGDAVFVHALDGQILDANPAACRLLGYSRAELLGMTTAEVDDPEFAAGYRERLGRQVSDGRLECQGRHRTKDGRVIAVEINTSAVRIDDRPAVMAVIRDVSTRRALEEATRALAESQAHGAEELAAKNAELRRSETGYRLLTEGCLDGVIAADAEGRIALFNPAAERMFGRPAAEALGQPLTLLFPPRPADAAGRAPGFERFVCERDPQVVGKTVEVVGRRADGGEFPMELSLSRAGVGDEVRYIGMARDVSERQRMRDALARSDKLASIGLLSAGVAHEINNPLAYVGNNIAVMERDLLSLAALVALYEETHPALESAAPAALAAILGAAEEFDWPYVRENLPKMLGRTREGVQRVANIVANLRGLARTSAPKMETVPVPDLVDGALEMVRGRLRRQGIEVGVRHDPGVPLLPCVPAQISQVILNLLVNAAQAAEAGVRDGVVGAGGGRVDFASSLQGPDVVLAVSDNGPGIDDETLPKLFDPFFTTKGVGEGTGLGLSICHGIVTGHGGRIEVVSRPGAGATFRVLLPARRPGES